MDGKIAQHQWHIEYSMVNAVSMIAKNAVMIQMKDALIAFLAFY